MLSVVDAIVYKNKSSNKSESERTCNVQNGDGSKEAALPPSLKNIRYVSVPSAPSTAALDMDSFVEDRKALNSGRHMP